MSNTLPYCRSLLSGKTDITVAKTLGTNLGISFQAGIKVGPFNLPGTTAREMLASPLNPNGLPNSDVVRRFVNSLDIVRRPRDVWIIDFGVGTPIDVAALYEAPFEYVRQHVHPVRAENRDRVFRERWWLHGRPRVDMRSALRPLR